MAARGTCSCQKAARGCGCKETWARHSQCRQEVGATLAAVAPRGLCSAVAAGGGKVYGAPDGWHHAHTAKFCVMPPVQCVMPPHCIAQCSGSIAVQQTFSETGHAMTASMLPGLN